MLVCSLFSVIYSFVSQRLGIIQEETLKVSFIHVIFQILFTIQYISPSPRPLPPQLQNLKVAFF